MTHTQACSDVWLIVLFLFSAQVDNIGDCMETLISVDDNNDQQGFMEFMIIAATLAGGQSMQWKQANCSQCIAMEYYNI